jgi:hypothetical protein
MKLDGVLANVKKITSNPNTVSFVIVIVMILFIYVAYSKLIDMATKPQDIPYATRTMKEKEQITADKIGTVQLSGNFVSLQGENLETNRGRIIDQYVADGYIIPQGSLFYKEAIANESTASETIYAGMPDTYAPFKLAVDFHSTYGCSIMPGDYIDLFFSGLDDNGKLIFGMFIKSIKVYAVLDANGLDVFMNTTDDQQFAPSHIVFAVPTEYYELLEKTVRLGYKLLPVPRNDTYSENHEQTSIAAHSIRDFVIGLTSIKDSNGTN